MSVYGRDNHAVSIFPASVTNPATAPAQRPIRLLLINPRCPESFWSFRWAITKILPGKRALNPPLGLATLAALCPPNWEVTVVDENIETVPLEPDADIVGVCGMAVQFPRQQELLTYFRKRGHHVVAGGSYASLCPESFEAIADTVVAGEAEYIWPVFCRDFADGAPQRRYQEAGVVDLADSPTPRFDLLKLDKYLTVGLQFSRGCPYRCEFCDIIVMFGRRPRTKRPEQVGRELDLLRSLGTRSVFFVDDNFIGHSGKAKALLRYLVDYQQSHRYAFQFGTEASLNLADDDALMSLFRAANFAWVFIGIESSDEESLRETGKTQNLRRDIPESLRRIYRHGIDVLGGFIIGFDNDTLETFPRQEHFITTTGIQVAMVGLLTALPRTPLYERLQREGRLIHEAPHGDNTRAGTNIVPKRMGYAEMIGAYKDLYRRLVSDEGISARIHNKRLDLRAPLYRDAYPLRHGLGIVARLLAYGVLPGGPGRWLRFFGTLGASAPRTWPLVINDWIAGLAMRDHVERRFGLDHSRERPTVQATLEFIERRYAACLRRGALAVSAAPAATLEHLEVTLRGYVEPRFFTRAGRRLEQLLRRPTVQLTLHIEELAEGQRHQLDRLLRRLDRYGERVSIRINENLRTMLAIDSSVFHLVLEDSKH